MTANTARKRDALPHARPSLTFPIRDRSRTLSVGEVLAACWLTLGGIYVLVGYGLPGIADAFREPGVVAEARAAIAEVGRAGARQ